MRMIIIITVSGSDDKKPAKAPVAPAAKASTRSVDSDTLFCGHRLLLIEHRGEQYRLGQTKSGKLILTK